MGESVGGDVVGEEVGAEVGEKVAPGRVGVRVVGLAEGADVGAIVEGAWVGLEVGAHVEGNDDSYELAVDPQKLFPVRVLRSTITYNLKVCIGATQCPGSIPTMGVPISMVRKDKHCIENQMYTKNQHCSQG